MRCPKCGYITFDHVTACSKCKASLEGMVGEIQGTSLNVTPPSLLGSVTKNAPSSGNETSVDEMLQGHEFDLSLDDSQQEIAPDIEESFDHRDSAVPDTGDLSFEDLPSFDDNLSADDDDEIPTLMPVSEISAESEPNSRLERLTSDLKEIDLSDLIAPSSALESENDIPVLQPIDDTEESIPTLEPLSNEDLNDIPSLEPLAPVQELTPNFSSDEALEDLDLPSDSDLDEDLALLLDDANLGDLDIDASNFDEFSGTDEPHVEGLEGGSLSDFFESPASMQVQEPQPDVETTSLSGELPTSATRSLAEDLFASPQDDILDQQSPELYQDAATDFDLSFDDVAENQAVVQPTAEEASEFTLELEHEPDVPLKTKPKTIATSIPDLGLTLESDHE